ncbi:unnamed protein product [Pleuronectes platessa]|uniref:Uncharacterized protein n=1 Tax=Pleuronectes platessa TaxID=8262 RepID=A0A9N7VRJ3_PLEPL|nr:unnamed protein product [Pleuronectes platessa]
MLCHLPFPFERRLSDSVWVRLRCGFDRSGPVTCLCVKKPVGDRKPSVTADRKHKTSDRTSGLGDWTQRLRLLTQPHGHFRLVFMKVCYQLPILRHRDVIEWSLFSAYGHCSLNKSTEFHLEQI